MNRLRRRWQARATRRETLVLALLTYHRAGLTGAELRRYVGGTAPALYVTLDHLERDGRIRAWWAVGHRPRHRLYALPEGEIR